MPVTIDTIETEVDYDRRAKGEWDTYELGQSDRTIPNNMWDAELQGYTPTAEDYQYWEEQESLAPALDMLIRAGDFGWCESTSSDGATARNACFKGQY